MKICNVNTGKIIKRVLGLPLYSVYFLSWLFPRDKKIWVFGCNDGFVSNPKYLFLYTANKRDEIKTVWISKEEDVRRKLRKMGYNAQSRQSFKGIYYVLKAKYFFVNQNSHEISYWLSGGSKKIILWHGLPFKKISYDAKKGRFGYFSNLKGIKKFILRLLTPWGFERKDFVITTSPLFQKIMASAFRVDKNKVIITGYPRNDVFFTEIKNSDSGSEKFLFQRIRDLKRKGKKIIFYLPTFRDTGGNPLVDANFDFNKLKKFLNSNNAIFITSFHKLANINEKDFQKLNSEEFLVLASGIDIYQILRQTDILITDYSSVFFDFLLTDRLIIFFPYDFQKYIAEDRELYFDYNEFTPGPKAYNFNELLNQLEHFLRGEDGYETQREKIKNICFSHIDGNSSERVFKMICD